MNGLLLINKPATWTSRDICNKIQHFYHVKRVGHTGTLDPFATGLMIITIDKATKIGSYLEHLDKEYIAELKLGVETSTGDNTGEVINEKEVPNIDEDKLINVLNSFLGKKKQIPPMTSAQHYKGQKLYVLAHQGIVVERQSKDIEIYNIELLSFDKNIIKFKVKVSKGTYIRVLGEDIAKALGTVGHLISLHRTKVGNQSVEDAIEITDLNKAELINPSVLLKKEYKTLEVDPVTEQKIKDGIKFKFDLTEELIYITNSKNEPIAIMEKVNGIYRTKRGLW